jgi:enamine deaminase RidA (YjgF/YER057c/UK114 family)
MVDPNIENYEECLDNAKTLLKETLNQRRPNTPDATVMMAVFLSDMPPFLLAESQRSERKMRMSNGV